MRSPGAKVAAVTVSPTCKLAGLVAELGQVLVRAGVGLAQMAELGLGQVLLAGHAEGQLHGLVAVALACGCR